MEHIGSLMATMGIDIAQAEKNIAKIEKDVKQYAKVVETEFKKIEKESNQSEKIFKKYADTIDKEISSVKKDLIALEKQYGSLATTTGSSLDKVEGKVKKHSTAINALLKTVRAAVLGYATVLATTKIVDFTTGIVKAGVELDSFERSLVAITKSQKQARYEFDFVNKVAQDYGLNLQALRQSYVGLLASSQKTNLAGEETRRLFVATSAAASVLGMSTDDAQGSLKAFVQMISKGNVQAEELRGQLGDRLYGAFNKAAEAMGVSTSKLNDMLKDGDVLASDLIPKLTRLLEGEFLQAAKAAAVGPRASFEKLNTAVLKLQESISNNGVLDSFADLADETTRWVKINEKLISQNLSVFFKAIAVGGEVALKIIGGLANKFDQLANAIKFVSGLFDDINDIEDPIKRTKATITELQKSLLDLYSGYNFVSEKTRKQRDIEIAQIKKQIENYKNALKLYKEQKLVLSIDTSLGENFDEIDVLFKELVDKSRLAQDDIQKNTDKALEKEIKATRKALDKIIANRKKAYETLLKQQEKYKEDISEYLDTYNLSDYDKKLYYLEKEIQAFKKVGLKEIDYAEYVVAKKQEINNDYYEQQRKEADKLAKAQQDAYDDLYKTTKGYVRDVIDDFDNMGDTLVDLAKNMAKDIAAAFLTEKIVMPIILSAGSAIGLTGSGGVPYSAMAGNGLSGSSILSGANTAYGAFSGATSTMAFDATLGIAEPALGMLGYDTATASAMASGWAGTAAAIAPYLSIAAMALPLISSFFESEPEPRIGIRKGNISDFGYNPTTKDMSNQSPINDYIVEYYDAYFSAIDELTSNAVKDVLANTDWERLRVHPEDFDSVEDALFAANDLIFKKFADGFISGLANGQLDGYLDESFFEDIRGENESLLDSFIRFGSAIETTDDFVSQFTSQIDDLGISAVDAFENVSVITSALEEVSDSIDAISTVTAVTTLNDLTDSWESLIESLKTANATTEQLAGAESGMAHVLGANITGLTANALQSTLMSGGDVDSIIKSSIQSAAYADIAQKIADGYVSGINEEIGQVWIDTGGDIEAVVEAMRNIDTSGAMSEISDLQDAFELIEDAAGSATDALVSTAEASRLVTMAIDGQLSASQQFQEWQIENIQAMNLFSDITANGVTQSELEGAVDAFAELGIAGDDLNNVIGDLANRFTEASDDLVASLSSITSAQGNLSSVLGDETAAETLESLQSQFKNFQSWSDILGSETVTKQVEVKPTTADYEDLVNDLFNTMFGRDAAQAGLDYWVGALKDASDGVDYTNIMQSMLDGAKASAKSGNLLSAKDLLYYVAAQPTIKEVNPLESTYEEQTRTISGSISSELESSIYDTIDALEALPELVTNGVVNESNIAEWVDVISSANNEALNRLFGEDSETMINSLANAIDDYNAITETASDTTNSLSKAIDNTQELMDDYISYLETEIDTRQDALDDAKSVLEEYIESEEALIDARRAASDDINDFINSLYGSTSAPVQSMEFFEKRYSQLLQDAKNADAENVGDAVSNLTSFASKYLDFAGSYGGDNYSDVFDSVTSELSAVAGLQDVFARVQERGLDDVAELIGDSNDELIDINEAIKEFKAAEIAVDDNVWMTNELEKLGAIEDNLSLLLDAQVAYYNKIGEDVPDNARLFATGSNILQGTIDELGIGLSDSLFTTLSSRIQSLIDRGIYSDMAAGMIMSQRISQIGRSGIGIQDLSGIIGGVSDDYQFSGGGIISGPMSGYQLPSATFHGTEAIIPLSNGSIPVHIQTPQNVNVQVFIDGKEIKTSVIKTIRTDPEAQTQIRRVANG